MVSTGRWTGMPLPAAVEDCPGAASAAAAAAAAALSVSVLAGLLCSS